MSLPVVAARALSDIRAKKVSLKTCVYNSSFKNKKQLMKAVCQSLTRWTVLEEISSSVGLCKRIKRLKNNPELVVVVLNEFVYNDKLAGCFSTFKAGIYQHKAAIHAAVARIKIREKVKDLIEIEERNAPPALPRYVRINTIKGNIDDVEQSLEASGYTFTTVDEFPTHKNSVSKDKHLTELLVFHARVDLHENNLCKNGTLILQDKASCLPAHILNPPAGSNVIDACAAPGNKTSHLAAIMNNKGEITAFEKDQRRSEILQRMLDRAGVTCATVENTDFLQVDVSRYDTVEYMLVDPSCSGSGIVDRMDQFIESNDDDSSEERLEKLSNFQVQILNKALSFPAVKRLVYSTCSVHIQENEQVVQMVLSENPKFELESAMCSWKSRGQTLAGEFPVGERCIRASPEVDHTIGFFVALFKKKSTKKSKSKKRS